MFDSIFETIRQGVNAIIDFVVDILNRIIDLSIDIVNWFKNKYKKAKDKILYLITVRKLKSQLEGTKAGDIFANVPTRVIPNLYGDDTKFEDGLAEVVEDTDTNTISEIRVLGGEGIDQGIKDIMKGEEAIKCG